MATACSGTGSPSFALRELIGADNFKEVVSSEKHAHWLAILQCSAGVFMRFARTCFAPIIVRLALQYSMLM